jgi:SAM-dependent methyltransferase
VSKVIWHDLECGAYRRDLGLWLALAADCGDPVLDIGAGTGRVTLELARAGHEVVAVDLDPDLLDELQRRAADLPGRVRCVRSDARQLALEQRFSLCVVPMQTIQLLGGAAGRAAFLDRARAHLMTPGGLLAVAITGQLEPFEVEDGEPGPLPDMRELDGVVYCSCPTAVRREGGVFVLERRRETVAVDGTRAVELDRIGLDVLSARELTREGELAGFTPAGTRRVPPTADHVGSEVVLLRA